MDHGYSVGFRERADDLITHADVGPYTLKGALYWAKQKLPQHAEVWIYAATPGQKTVLNHLQVTEEIKKRTDLSPESFY